MSLAVALADVRDVVVIIYGVIGILFFAVAVIVALVLGFSVKGLLRTVKEMLDDSVKPTLESVKGAAETVKGTTDFVGRTAVAPIARTYGMFAGVKKGFSVFTAIKNKGK